MADTSVSSGSIINDLGDQTLVCYRYSYRHKQETTNNLKIAEKLIRLSLAILNMIAATGAPIAIKEKWRLKDIGLGYEE